MYPIAFAADYVPERSRLTTFFRYLMAIPVFIVALFWGIAAWFTVIGAWFALVLTGRYPEGLYDFNTKVLRFQTRAASYLALLTDAYPPFGGDDDPRYPVRVALAPPLPEYSRLKAGLRLIYGIPVLIMLYLYGILLGVVPVLSWFAIVFTGRQPEGLQDLSRMGMSYHAKGYGYMMLLTETYPPVTDKAQLETSEQAPQLGG
jgi:Domain of unknown function (DUF4389)